MVALVIVVPVIVAAVLPAFDPIEGYPSKLFTLIPISTPVIVPPLIIGAVRSFQTEIPVLGTAIAVASISLLETV